MARPANQASGGGDTNAPKKKLYAWGGGKAVHSKSESAHRAAVTAKLSARAPGSSEAPVDPLYESAQAQAAGMYAPQMNALDTLERSAPAWYDNYRNQTTAAATASRNFSQPVIDQAGQFAQNVNAPAAGLDPNSAEYARSQQAGKGLSALATFGQQNLQANQNATTDYFGAQQANAAAALPGVLANVLQQKGVLGTEIGGKALELYQQLHAQAANEDIARQTLNLNQSNTAFDNTLSAGYDPLTGKPLPPEPASPSDEKTAADLAFFKEHGYYPPTGPPKPASTDKSGLTPAQKQAQKNKDAAALETRRTSSKKAASRVSDLAGRLNGYLHTPVQTGKTVKNKDGSTQAVTRAPTKAEIEKMALGDDFTSDEFELARTINAKKRLTAAQVDLAHRIGVTHIPREWLPLKYKVRRPGNASGGQTGGDRPT